MGGGRTGRRRWSCVQQLRVGIVGAGMAYERLHLPAYRRLQDRYRIVSVCDADEGRAARAARDLGLPDSAVERDAEAVARRDDVDVVDVMVPIGDNYRVTKAAAAAMAERGGGGPRGVVCEKPLAANLREAEQARALPAKYGVPILIAENDRFNEESDTLSRLVADEHAGMALCFVQLVVSDQAEAIQGTGFSRTEWRQHPDFPGGMILDKCVHDVALLHRVFGSIDEVQAVGVPQDEEWSPFAVLQANLRFHSGMTGSLTYCCRTKEMQRPLVGLRILCERGEIFLEERDCGTINVAFRDGGSEQIPYTPKRGYDEELLRFHEHLTGGAPLESPPEIEYGDTRAVLAMIKSAQQNGRRQPVDPEPALV